MPLNRITYYWRLGKNGWSESVHNQLTDTIGLVQAARVYLNFRLAFTHASVSCEHIRISDDLVYRDLIFDPVQLPQIGQWKPQVAADAPWTALDMRLGAGLQVNAPVQVTRSLFLRGLPAGQRDGSTYKPTADFGTAVAAFVTVLSGSSFGVKNKDRSQKKQPILSIALDGTVVMSTGVDNVAKDLQVQVLGIPRSVLPKRTYTVINVVDTSHFQLRGYSGPPILQQGFLRLVNYVILPIQQVSTNDMTERRTGRPFGELRGRRAVVR